MKQNYLLFFLLLASTLAHAQNKTLGVGTPTPNPNAALHVESPTGNQGFIMPRLTTAQRNAMASLPLTTNDEGMMVYDKDVKKIYTWNGSQWVSPAKYLVTDPASTDTALTAKTYSNQLHGYAISAIHKGTGDVAGFFLVDNAASNAPSIYGEQRGTGPGVMGAKWTTNGSAGSFLNGYNNNNSPALYTESNSNITNASTLVSAMNGSGGNAGFFGINNPANTHPGLVGVTAGTGSAGLFEILNGANTSPALFVNTSGTGNAIETPGKIQAGQFVGDGSLLTNISASPFTFPFNTPQSTATTTFDVANTGAGSSGSFSIINAANNAAALRAETNGTGNSASFTRNATSNNATLFSQNQNVGQAAVFAKTGAGGGAPIEVIQNGTGDHGAVFLGQNASNTGNLIFAHNFMQGTAAFISQNNASGHILDLASNYSIVAHVDQTGKVVANSFQGDGSQLTNVASSSLTFPIVQTNTNAGNGATLLDISTNAAVSSDITNVAHFQNLNPAALSNILKVTNEGIGAAFLLSSNGTGSGGVFQTTNATNSLPALRGTTNGTGNAVRALVNNSGSSAAALDAQTNGTGNAVYGVNYGAGNGSAALFEITEITNTAPAMNVNTAGVGAAANFYISEPTNNISTINANTDGTGNAGYFSVNNVASGASGVYATTNGTGAALQAQTSTGFSSLYARREGATNGNAGLVEITNAANSYPAFQANTAGTGSAGRFEVTNSSATSPGLEVVTNAQGGGIRSNSTGVGYAGYFEVNNTLATPPAVQVNTNAAGGGLRTSSAGSGYAGWFEINNSGNNDYALRVETNGNGSAVFANQSNNGLALEITAGGVKNSTVTESTPGEISARAGVVVVDAAGTYTLSTTGRSWGETIIVISEAGGNVTISLGGGYEVIIENTYQTATFVYYNGQWRGTGANTP